MTLLSPGSLLLALLLGVVLLLSLFRTQRLRRHVATMGLWEGLLEDPRSRAVRRRIPLDLLLLLQCLTLAALVVALAEPALLRSAQPVEDIAIVLDGSASMRSAAGPGQTAYDAAIVEALHVLDASRATRTTVVQLTTEPRVLVARTERQAEARTAISSSSPSAFGDGAIEGLLAALAGVGGRGAFDRIVVISDHDVVEPGGEIESIRVEGGENLSIDRFSVREDPTADGVLAFLQLANGTDRGRDAMVYVDDGFSRVELGVSLPARSEEAYVVPFPGSRSARFTATLEVNDAFPDDNTRYFALQRPLDLRVRWIGSENRYLEAALEAVVPVRVVDEEEPADLTVVNGTDVPPLTEGNVLFLHGSFDGYVAIGPDVAGGEVLALQPDHPLLRGVDARGLRVRAVPTIEEIASGDVLLAAEEVPLLVEFESENRTVTFFSADLLATNLPITVDFPVLIRNLVARLVRLPADVSHRWDHPGEPLPLGIGQERIVRIIDPSGRSIDVTPDQQVFLPESPGFYRLQSDRGTYALAVNVSPTESAPAAVREERGPGTSVGDVSAIAETVREGRLLGLWPILTVLALLLLGFEMGAYRGVLPRPWGRRT